MVQSLIGDVVIRLVHSKRRATTGRNWDYFVAQGKLAWENSGGSQPMSSPKDGSWQAKAWKEGFDKAYNAERPFLCLDEPERPTLRVVK